MQQEPIITIEKIVLSSIFFSPDKFEEIAAELKADDFLLPSHRDIFEMCVYLSKNNFPIDTEMLLAKKPAHKKITQEELLEILAINPIANIEAYIGEIKEASIKRELHTLANFLREKSLDNHQNVDEIIDDVERRLNDVSFGKTEDNVYNAQEVVSDVLDYLKDLKNRGNTTIVGLDTGFRELNRVTTGFNKGDLIIIGARPSMGKTTFVLNLAQHILDSNQGVVIFSLEMPYMQLGMRMLSAKASIALQNLRTANLTNDELSTLSAMADKMAAQPLHIVDASSLSIAQLKGGLRRLKRQHPEISIAIVDYLQLMNGGKGEYNKQAEISEISRGLKMLARELDMPIIALSQLNRLVESRDDKRPTLSDLRDSGAIEQDADVILFLYREDVYKKREDKERYARLKKEGKEKDFKPEHQEREIEPTEIIVAKNRNGEVKTIDIQFNKRFIRFEDKPREMEHDMTETSIDGEVFLQQIQQDSQQPQIDMPNIF
ncbi:replicative DNA helicase [Helicobacter marmotae]|uniref:Replicative DNA helicase n=1 Tax=Helicobacter marmotae TaxID=152490 RepID=A0A3D8I7M8_9HELI|nr:replicative DNA helicase [Helicobacter marmotae]RDU60754.1 replicative DNA helicase [Helicobacter marmotae]